MGNSTAVAIGTDDAATPVTGVPVAVAVVVTLPCLGIATPCTGVIGMVEAMIALPCATGTAVVTCAAPLWP